MYDDVYSMVYDMIYVCHVDVDVGDLIMMMLVSFMIYLVLVVGTLSGEIICA